MPKTTGPKDPQDDKDKKPKKKTSAEWQAYFDAKHGKDSAKSKDFSGDATTAQIVRELHRVTVEQYRAAGGKL